MGSLIGMTELGWFSAVFTLTLAPTLVIAKTLNTFFLPQLSKVQNNLERYGFRLYLVTVQATLLAGVALAVIFAIAGPALFLLLYGFKYEPAVPLIVWLAVMQSIRLSEAGPAIVATAKAETKNPLMANLTRVLFLPIAWITVELGAGLILVIVLAIVGEVAGIGNIYFDAKKPAKATNKALGCTFVRLRSDTQLSGVGTMDVLLCPVGFTTGKLFLAASLIIMVLSMPDLRKWVRSFYSDS